MPQVTGPITTTSTSDTYPTHESMLGLGGLHSAVADHPTRDAIPNDRREEGMIVYTQNDTLYWQLLPSPWAGTDADWVQFAGVPDATFTAAGKVKQTVYNIRDYGAAGDGTTDDTAAFTNAISAASNGGIIYVPPTSTNYHCSSNISLGSNQTLRGDGYGSCIKFAQAMGLQVSSQTNTVIENLRVDGANHVANNQLVQISSPNDVTVRGCWLTNVVGFGVFLTSTGSSEFGKARVEDCHIFGQGNNDQIGGGPTDATSTLSELIIKNNYISQDASINNHYSTCIDMVAGNKTVIEGNITQGRVILGGEKIPHYHVNIVNNIVRPGISLDYTQIAVLTSSNAGQTADSTYINIENNQVIQGHIFLQGQSSTSSPTKFVNIIGNNIEASTTAVLADFTWAIDIAWLTTVQIIGNIISGAAVGIHYATVTNMIVADNTLDNCTAALNASGTNANVTFLNNPGLNPQGVYAQGNVTGATTFNRQNGDVITATLTGNITITLTAPTYSGEVLTLQLTQDATGGRTASWPGNVGFNGTFTLSNIPNAIDIITLKWYGSAWREFSRYQNTPHTDDLVVSNANDQQITMKTPGYNTVYQRNFEGQLYTYLGTSSNVPDMILDNSASLQTGGLTTSGGIETKAIATPAAPTVTNIGTAGSTSYTYTVTAVGNTGETVASTGTVTATGNATLNGTNYNVITITPLRGAQSYNIYRTTSAGTPSTTGLIGSVTAPNTTTVIALNDTGLVASGTSPATDLSVNSGFGISSPTAVLHLQAGTSQAHTAPFKLNSGTVLTTPEAGAIEFDGSHLYVTIGSTRNQLDGQSGSGTYLPLTGGTLTGNLLINQARLRIADTGSDALMLDYDTTGTYATHYIRNFQGTINWYHTTQSANPKTTVDNNGLWNMIATLAASSGSQTAFTVGPIITQTSTAGYTALLINPTESTTGSGNKLLLDLKVGGTEKFNINDAGLLTLIDGGNIQTGSTTGTIIATATTQKLGFYGTTPVVQPGATTDLGTVLSTIGLRAAGTAYPITTSGTVTFSGTTTAPTLSAGDNTTNVATTAFVTTAVNAGLQGLSIKDSCQEATVGTETFTILSGTVTTISGTTLDGVSPAIGDRILIKDAPAATGTGAANSTQPGNGIYTVTANVTNLLVSRSNDMSGTNGPNGAFTFVESGTANASAGFTVSVPSTTGAFTYGTNNIKWTQFSGAGEVTAGTGLTKSGNTISIENSGVLLPTHGGTGVANNVASTLTISGAFGTTLTVSATTNLTLPTSGTVTALGNTTTGSGSTLVLATSPSLITPVLGAATATSINKVALTAPATGSTLTIADGKTLTANNSLTLAGTDATTMTFPAASNTIAGLGTAQSFTKQNMFNIASTIVSATAASLDDIDVDPATTTITGNTGSPITRLAKVGLYQPTLTDSSVVTVTDAATLYIDNAPLAAGSVTITNPWALLIGAGATNLQATTINAALTYGGVALSNAVTGTAKMVLSTSPSLTTPSLGAATGTGLILTGTSANTLTAGANGSTNPVLQIDASISSVVTGIVIQGAATNGVTTIKALDTAGSGHGNIAISGKGGGYLSIGDVNTGVNFFNRGSTKALFNTCTLTALGSVQNTTPTATQIIGGFLSHASTTGAGTATFDTGTNIDSQLNNSVVGDSFEVVYANIGTQTVTLTSATGMTFVGTVAIPAGKIALVKIIRTGTHTWNGYVIMSA